MNSQDFPQTDKISVVYSIHHHASVTGEDF